MSRQMSMFSVLLRVFQRDIRLAWRRKSDIAGGLFFFIITTSLFPLGLGADPKLLHAIAPGVLWVCALLSCMLSLPRIFEADYVDGSLEQLMLSNQPSILIILMKIITHWVLAGLPLILVAPLIGLQFDLNVQEIKTLMIALLLGSPTLSLIGSVGSALTLGTRGGSVLIAILVLPLYIPILVFGAGAVNAVATGMSADGALSLLGAIFAIALVFTPLASVAAIKIALE
jgi:heme exporter protein B